MLFMEWCCQEHDENYSEQLVYAVGGRGGGVGGGAYFFLHWYTRFSCVGIVILVGCFRLNDNIKNLEEI